MKIDSIDEALYEALNLDPVCDLNGFTKESVWMVTANDEKRAIEIRTTRYGNFYASYEMLEEKCLTPKAKSILRGRVKKS